jgi:hypothetical protein
MCYTILGEVLIKEYFDPPFHCKLTASLVVEERETGDEVVAKAVGAS